MARPFRLVLVALVALTAPIAAQRGTLVMALPTEALLPVPVLGTTSASDADVADQMFLRLAGLGASGRLAGDDAMVPELAASWRRQNATTVDFLLDPRARWHDGTPVTARDVAFTWSLMREPGLGMTQAPLEPIADVVALNARTVRVTFRRSFSEQVYLAGFTLQPLPEHLLRGIPPAQLAQSDFVRSPVGNGPFRFERRVPGQFLELRAEPTHFRGRPGLGRLVFRVATDATARTNLFLAGETDVLPDLPPPVLAEVGKRPQLRTVSVTSGNVNYILLNSRQPSDTAAPHAILSDVRVREALALALDRRAIVTSVWGPTAAVPEVVQSQFWAWATGGLRAVGRDAAGARQLLEAAGWRDTDGDGLRDRNGQPLRLTLILPSTSATRRAAAVQAERMWREVGVEVMIDVVEPGDYGARRLSGRWDLEIAGANQSPSPSSVVQSWSCASAAQPRSSNVARICDPTFDRLVRAADTAADPLAAYGAAFARLAAVRPAIGLVAPTNTVGVHARFANVVIRPVSAWTDLWRWTVRPDQLLPRDR